MYAFAANQDRIQGLRAEADKVKAGSLQLQQEVVLLRGQLTTEQQKAHRQNWDDIVGENTKLRSDVKTLNDQKLEIEKLFRRYKGSIINSFWTKHNFYKQNLL